MSFPSAELQTSHEPWTRTYWLTHCEGYSVEFSRGRVGYVEDVVLSAEQDRAVALRVRPTRGYGLIVVPIEHVCGISPSLEQILVEEAWAQRFRGRAGVSRI
jgi:hypothetical protein